MQTVIDKRETCLCAKFSGMDAIINLKTDFKTRNSQIVGTSWGWWKIKRLLI